MPIDADVNWSTKELVYEDLIRATGDRGQVVRLKVKSRLGQNLRDVNIRISSAKQIELKLKSVILTIQLLLRDQGQMNGPLLGEGVVAVITSRNLALNVANVKHSMTVAQIER